MKHTLITVLFIAFSLASFAQKIYFTDSTNQWTYYIHNCSGETGITSTAYSDIYSGDSVIGSTSYRRLLHNTIGGGTIFVREDTISHKVYAWTGNGTTDYLLYDYTLSTGDTFHVYPGAPDNETYYVASMDSVRINALWYKTWHFKVAYGQDLIDSSYTVIEGIGSDFQPIFPVFLPNNVEHCFTLTCFHNNGTTSLVSPEVDGYFDNAGSCSLTFTGVKNVSTQNNTAAIYPNPLDQTSKMVFSYSMRSGSLVVLNYIGQAIINTTFENTNELEIGSIVRLPGIYFYFVTDNASGQIFSGKMVTQ